MSATVKSMPQLVRAPARLPDKNKTDFSCPLCRFRVEQYEKMIEAGVPTSSDHVELMEVIVIQKMTQHSPHAGAIEYTLEAFRPLLPEGRHLREQKPVKLRDSAPEPDLVVVRGPFQRYERQRPTPRDIASLIEVADVSLEGDCRDKGRAYALARIPSLLGH